MFQRFAVLHQNPKVEKINTQITNNITHSLSTVSKQWGVAVDKIHNMTRLFLFRGPMVVYAYAATAHVQKQIFLPVIGVGAPTSSKRARLFQQW